MHQRRGLELYGMWIPGNSPIPMLTNTRVRWVWDPDYPPEREWPSKKEFRTRWIELDKLERGELVALGCIMETSCLDCGQWRELDSLWGIVIGADKRDLKDFFVENRLGACFEGEHWNKGKDDD